MSLLLLADVQHNSMCHVIPTSTVTHHCRRHDTPAGNRHARQHNTKGRYITGVRYYSYNTYKRPLLPVQRRRWELGRRTPSCSLATGVETRDLLPCATDFVVLSCGWRRGVSPKIEPPPELKRPRSSSRSWRYSARRESARRARPRIGEEREDA